MASATTTPQAPADITAGGTRRTSLVRWILGGTLAAAILAVVAIAVWPASEADKAREDGKQLGEAVGQLYNAQSTAEVDAALAEINTAMSDTRDHAGDAVADHVADQEDALSRAAEGFVGVHSSTDAFEVDLYQAELNTALDDLSSQAEDFEAQGSDVQQAFYDGFQEGLPGD